MICNERLEGTEQGLEWGGAGPPAPWDVVAESLSQYRANERASTLSAVSTTTNEWR